MAVNYLIINSFSTNTISDSVVTDFGDIKGAIPRYDEQKKLFGMNGQYNIEDGAYDGYERTFKLFVKRYEDAQAMIQAGANRIGTSSGVAIMKGEVAHGDY